MTDKVKIQNIDNPKITMTVKKSVAGTYVGTNEWKVVEEKLEEKPKEENKMFGNSNK